MRYVDVTALIFANANHVWKYQERMITVNVMMKWEMGAGSVMVAPFSMEERK